MEVKAGSRLPTEINKTGSHSSSSSSSQGSSRSSKAALPSATIVGNQAITGTDASTLSRLTRMQRIFSGRRVQGGRGQDVHFANATRRGGDVNIVNAGGGVHIVTEALLLDDYTEIEPECMQ